MLTRNDQNMLQVLIHLIYHKSEFVALKADVNKLGIKLSDAVDKEVYKKAI